MYKFNCLSKCNTETVDRILPKLSEDILRYVWYDMINLVNFDIKRVVDIIIKYD